VPGGAWGLQGLHRIIFKAADDEIVGEAMTLAWQNSARRREEACREARPENHAMRKRSAGRV
jgi:hypothetical protein